MPRIPFGGCTPPVQRLRSTGSSRVHRLNVSHKDFRVIGRIQGEEQHARDSTRSSQPLRHSSDASRRCRKRLYIPGSLTFSGSARSGDCCHRRSACPFRLRRRIVRQQLVLEQRYFFIRQRQQLSHIHHRRLHLRTIRQWSGTRKRQRHSLTGRRRHLIHVPHSCCFRNKLFSHSSDATLRPDLYGLRRLRNGDFRQHHEHSSQLLHRRRGLEPEHHDNTHEY